MYCMRILLLVLLAVPLAVAIPDLTGDNSVGIGDLLFVLERLGTNDFDADVNQDGIVDLLDLVLVARAYGSMIDDWIGSGDELYPNQPEGWTVWREQEYHSLTDQTGSTWASSLIQEGELRLGVFDPTAPDGSGVVAEAFFPQGLPDGLEPGRMGTAAPPTREVFVGDYIKFSENFEYHNLGIKISMFMLPFPEGTIIFGGGGNGSWNTPAPSMRVSARTARTIINPDPLIAGEGWPHNMAEPPEYTRGDWMRREIYLRMNTPGMTDGALRMWLDGVLVTSYENIDFGTTQSDWHYLNYGFTWGGGGVAVPHDQYIRVAHTRMLMPAEPIFFDDFSYNSREELLNT